MKVLELFAGESSIGNAFERRGHSVFRVDWDESLPNINLYADVGTLSPEDIFSQFGHPDVVWASPDCTTYSVAGISRHRRKNSTGDLLPITDYARFCDETNAHLIKLIMTLHPALWFIENPRGGMRKMSFMNGLPRYTVTYCQYGDIRMKPTDIWTNHPDPKFRPPCKNGDPCHTPAPRGSRTGTQGIRGQLSRAAVPFKLCEHIVDICEEVIHESINSL